MNAGRMLGLLLVVIGSADCKRDAAPPIAAAAPIPAGALRITVDGEGYHPATVTVPASRPATLVFTRTSDDGCGQQLVFPDINLRRDLPLNQPVVVTVNAPATGRLAFTCGMDMYRGAVVVQ
jgi:plastocyanin domain-containing protein